MTYVLLAILGGAAGWYLFRYKQTGMNMYWCIGIGAVGGLLGAFLGSVFAFAAVILFKIIAAVACAYFLILVAQRYLKPNA